MATGFWKRPRAMGLYGLAAALLGTAGVMSVEATPQTANAVTPTEKAAMTSSSSAPDVRCRLRIVTRYSAGDSATTTGGTENFKGYIWWPPGCRSHRTVVRPPIVIRPS